MSDVQVALPSGYLRETRVYATHTTGITAFYLGATGTATGDLKANLTAGQTVRLSQGAGFGAGYNASANTGKRAIIYTDGTVPAGAYLTIDVDYFATDAEPPLPASVSPHASTHRRGAADDLLYMEGQDNPAHFVTMPWYAALNANSNTNGTVHLAYFTANQANTLTGLTIYAGTASAGATLARMGLYSVASNGNLTLVAQTANDTTILQSGSVNSSKTFDNAGGYPATFQTVIGQRYAMAFIIVGSTTAGQYRGVAVTGGMTNFISPRRAGSLTGQTDLPASITVGSIGSDPNPPYMIAC